MSETLDNVHDDVYIMGMKNTTATAQWNRRTLYMVLICQNGHEMQRTSHRDYNKASQVARDFAANRQCGGCK